MIGGGETLKNNQQEQVKENNYSYQNIVLGLNKRKCKTAGKQEYYLNKILDGKELSETRNLSGKNSMPKLFKKRRGRKNQLIIPPK